MLEQGVGRPRRRPPFGNPFRTAVATFARRPISLRSHALGPCRLDRRFDNPFNLLVRERNCDLF